MPGDETDFSPDVQPKIRLKGDMIGVHVPLLSNTILIDGPSAFELGLKLTRLGRRLEAVYEASRRDADDAIGEVDLSGDAEQAKAEYKAFVMEAMLRRLGIDPEDDLNLDEDYMTEPYETD